MTIKTLEYIHQLMKEDVMAKDTKLKEANARRKEVIAAGEDDKILDRIDIEIKKLNRALCDAQYALNDFETNEW